ncbi:MAG: hypothetical protein JWO80_1279 [Bryobacterales bacterium]|nr:hypothetical protein [Bryobacterales bacterium]
MRVSHFDTPFSGLKPVAHIVALFTNGNQVSWSLLHTVTLQNEAVRARRIEAGWGI